MVVDDDGSVVMMVDDDGSVVMMVSWSMVVDDGW
jgi:hypothetical protein